MVLLLVTHITKSQLENERPQIRDLQDNERWMA